MDPATIMALALQGLQAILNLIGQIKSQSGMTDDQLAAQVATLTTGNDALYQQMITALQPPKASS